MFSLSTVEVWQRNKQMWIARGGLFWCWFQMATQGNSPLCWREVTPRLYQMRCLYTWAFWEVQWMWNCCKADLSSGVGMSTTALTCSGLGVDHQHTRGTGTLTCWVRCWPLVPAWRLCTVSDRGIARPFPRWWCQRWPHGANPRRDVPSHAGRLHCQMWFRTACTDRNGPRVCWAKAFH